MIKNKIALLPTLLSIAMLYGLSSCNENQTFPKLQGSYLGQTVPGDMPELFAPSIISNGLMNRDIAISPDGNEIYTVVMPGKSLYSKIVVYKNRNGRWQKPELVSFSSGMQYKDWEPAISPDGKKMYFVSNRPLNEHDTIAKDFDIWATDKLEEGWGKPYNIGAPVNTDCNEYFPSVTNDGSIYFTRRDKGTEDEYIYRSRFTNGVWQPVEKLPKNVNCGIAQFNAFIDPAERFIIVPVYGMPDSYGETNYYIVFRNDKDAWSKPINMGTNINAKALGGWTPYISPDGKYFFFNSIRPKTVSYTKAPAYRQLMELNNNPENGNADIYWVSTKFIENFTAEFTTN